MVYLDSVCPPTPYYITLHVEGQAVRMGQKIRKKRKKTVENLNFAPISLLPRSRSFPTGAGVVRAPLRQYLYRRFDRLLNPTSDRTTRPPGRPACRQRHKNKKKKRRRATAGQSCRQTDRNGKAVDRGRSTLYISSVSRGPITSQIQY